MPRRKKYEKPGRPVGPDGGLHQRAIGFTAAQLQILYARALREKRTLSELVRSLVQVALDLDKQ